MSIVSDVTWTTGWNASEPPQIGHVSVPVGQGAWKEGAQAGFEYRDLRLADASGGLLGAKHIQTTAGSAAKASGWQCHDLDFEFFYVLDGLIKIETLEGDNYVLCKGSAGCHPPLYWHRIYDVSDDFECVYITAPATFATIRDRDAALPPRAAMLRADRKPTYTFESENAYKMGAGPRPFFKYRDFGTSTMTDRRLHIHVVRANGEAGVGTGWHYHSMAQWFLILGGWSYIRLENNPKVKLEYLDSMCLGRGPSMRHNVAPYSGDYAVLEMCVPAEYDTIAVPPPEDADAPPEGAAD